MPCSLKPWAFIIVAASLTGCATYHPRPLPTAPNPSATLPAADHPLTLEKAVSLAVERSPNLLVERKKANVAQAQAYAAGLLPDPQFSASLDHPTVPGPGLVNGYALGLAQDLQTLLTEPSRLEGSKAKQAQAKLDLLWAEWQTTQHTANLYAQKFFAARKVALLDRTAKILSIQSEHSARALATHDTTIDVAGSDLSASLDVTSQRDAAMRAAISADADLKTELNLPPEGSLELSDPGEPSVPSREQVKAALDNVINKRPDLLALKAGYHAQEQSVRTAILEQFPAINLGFNRASDTSNVHTTGLSVSLNIPIFGGTQAKIRGERATRAQLYAEYQARLDQTNADAWRIWQSLNLLKSQVERLGRDVPELRKMAETGQKAYRVGNLAPATYVLLETTLATRESELLDLKTTLWADAIALRTLLAMSPLLPGLAR